MDGHQQPKKLLASDFSVIAGGVLLLILLFSLMPCRQYFPDALLLAYDVETTPHLLLNPHHPLFPLGPQLVFQMLGGLGSGITALGVMMVWATIFGIIACWLMGLTLHAGGFKRATVLAGLGLFTFSNAIWYFSSTANQNSTALALHILTLYAIIQSIRKLPACPSKERIIGIGVLTSVATLGSQANLALLLPMSYLLVTCRTKPTAKIENCLLYFLTFIIIGGAMWAYLAYAVLGAGSLADFMKWQHSYVTDPSYWAHGIADSLRGSFHGAVELHLAYAFQPGSIFGSWRGAFGREEWFKEPLLKAGQAIILLFFVIETIRAIIGWLGCRSRNPIQTVGILTALPIILFSFVFTPEPVFRRILYLPGILLFIAPIIESDFKLGRPSLRRAWPLLLVIIALFLTNFTVKYLPESKQANNIYLNEARELAKRFDSRDKIIYSNAYEGDLRIKYTRYFTECNVYRAIEVVNTMRTNPAELEALFKEAVEKGGSIVVHADALYSVEGLAWENKRYGLDIRPGELAEYFKAHFTPVDHFMINDKAYIIMKPIPGYAGGK